ncbi:MAG: sugar ABC transporter substrate-binding protein [Dehalococcoidales bacterium]|nr:sugar ABC transporter substrate-binding protein [Dehalococcoidales bacterium]
MLEGAGGTTTNFDCALDPLKQVSFLEDQLSLNQCDAIVLHAANEAMLSPVVDKALAQGVPTYNWDVVVDTDSAITRVVHDFGKPWGSAVVGQYFVDYAKRTGKHLVIYEVFQDHTVKTSLKRHQGFHLAVDKYPDLIDVIISPDTRGGDELSATYTQDALTAHPEINGVFVHDGGGTGTLEGIKAAGRLVPPDDPKHVICAFNDIDTAVIKAMDDGLLEATGTHTFYDLCDIVVKTTFNHLILGKAQPHDITSPMLLVTKDNLDTQTLYGVHQAWPRMPAGEWDKWPIMDTSYEGMLSRGETPLICDGKDGGIDTPTTALRKELKGY